MIDKKKIELAKLVLSFISENSENKSIPVQVGTLNKTVGFQGFKKSDINHPVFEFEDRYIIYLETLDGKTVNAFKYYKHDLQNCINHS